jgi:hypothetical protein
MPTPEKPRELEAWRTGGLEDWRTGRVGFLLGKLSGGVVVTP